MHSGIATFHRQRCSRSICWSLRTAFLFALLSSFLLFSFLLFSLLLSSLLAVPLYAAPTLQSYPADAPPQLLLLPNQTTPLQLQVHIATLSLTQQEGTDDLLLSVDALYRLGNEGDRALTAEVQLAPDSGAANGSIPSASAIANISLVQNGQTLALQASEGRYFAQVSVAAEGQSVLQLRYSVLVPSGDLPVVHYPVNALDAWIGAASMRIALALPGGLDAVPSASWIEVTPTDWRFATPPDASNGVQPDIKWLYDGARPDGPVRLRFVRSERWRALQAAQSAGDFASAGAINRQLMESAQNIQASADVAERFYAQALAAYEAGLSSGGDGGALHAGLARLYRDRMLRADGMVDAAYAEQTVDEVEAAIAARPDLADDRTLRQWQVEGLRALLVVAKEQRTWQEALALIDRLAALPEPLVSRADLADERASILVRQALELLEAGERDAAVALAGESITEEALLPPASTQSLFARWEVTSTVGMVEQQITLVAVPAADQGTSEQGVARSALDALVERWATTLDGERFGVALSTDGPQRLRLDLRLPLDGGDLLVAALPDRADWALLRALLTQSPQIDEVREGRSRRVALTLPADLRAVGDQWSATAAGLERQADQIEASGPSRTSVADPALAEAALRTRIGAVNYRAAAEQWRALAEETWVLYTLSPGTASPGTASPDTASPGTALMGADRGARSWFVTVDSAPQTLSAESDLLRPARLMAIGLPLLLLLLLFTGLLWWLL